MSGIENARITSSVKSFYICNILRVRRKSRTRNISKELKKEPKQKGLILDDDDQLWVTTAKNGKLGFKLKIIFCYDILGSRTEILFQETYELNGGRPQYHILRLWEIASASQMCSWGIQISIIRGKQKENISQFFISKLTTNQRQNQSSQETFERQVFIGNMQKVHVFVCTMCVVK